MRLLEHVRQKILQDILAGRFQTGSRMPSQRKLAGELGCSQLTVNRALADLSARGYLTQRHGSGTYLNSQLPIHDAHTLRIFCDKPGIFWSHVSELVLEAGLTADLTHDPAVADLAILTHVKFCWSRSSFADIRSMASEGSAIAEAMEHCRNRQSLELDRTWQAVPILYLPYLLFCRKDIFDANSVPLPGEKAPWDSFLEYADRLTDASRNRHGFAWQPMVTAAVPFMRQCGGGLLRKDEQGNLQSLMNLPGSQKAMAAWRELGVRAGYCPGSDAPGSLVNGKSEFLSGFVAMFISSSNFAASLLQLNAFPWQATPLPDLGEHVTDGATILASIGVNARHPREGLRLIEALLSPLWQQRLASRLTGSPARPLSGSSWKQRDGDLSRLVAKETAVMRHDHSVPSQESYGLVYSMFLDYWGGKQTLAQATQRFDAWVEDYSRASRLAISSDID